MTEIFSALPGWTLLIPFVVLGIVLSRRWLFISTGVIVGLDTLAVLVVTLRPPGPGTYGGWAVLAVVVISAAALVVMWFSAGLMLVIQRIRRHHPGDEEFYT